VEDGALRVLAHLLPHALRHAAQAVTLDACKANVLRTRSEEEQLRGADARQHAWRGVRRRSGERGGRGAHAA
jgi:hypothetical protein